MIRRRCTGCGTELELDVLDPRLTKPVVLCPACAGPRREGAPIEGDSDGPVAIDELDADAVVVSGKVTF